MFPFDYNMFSKPASRRLPLLETTRTQARRDQAAGYNAKGINALCEATPFRHPARSGERHPQHRLEWAAIDRPPHNSRSVSILSRWPPSLTALHRIVARHSLQSNT